MCPLFIKVKIAKGEKYVLTNTMERQDLTQLEKRFALVVFRCNGKELLC